MIISSPFLFFVTFPSPARTEFVKTARCHIEEYYFYRIEIIFRVKKTTHHHHIRLTGIILHQFKGQDQGEGHCQDHEKVRHRGAVLQLQMVLALTLVLTLALVLSGMIKKSRKN